MARPKAADVATRSALALLWEVQGMAEEERRLVDGKAALALWLRNGHDCVRWIRVVAAGGRSAELPPMLLTNKAFFNGHDWRIP